MSEQKLSAGAIFQTATAYWQSQALFAAHSLGIFTFLSGRDNGVTPEEIRTSLDLQAPFHEDLLHIMAHMGYLKKVKVSDQWVFSNSELANMYLAADSPDYVGGALGLFAREYQFWSDLDAGLRTGKPQNEAKTSGQESFTAIYTQPGGLEQFTMAMNHLQRENFQRFIESFDFSPYQKFLDVGGGNGLLCALVAANAPHMQCVNFDLETLRPEFDKLLANYDQSVRERVTMASGDFFDSNPLPEADVFSMNNLLNSFDLENRTKLLTKVYEALPVNGKAVALETLIDDERSTRPFAMFFSLNMLIESDGGYCHTDSEMIDLAKEVGFKQTEIRPINGPVFAAIMTK